MTVKFFGRNALRAKPLTIALAIAAMTAMGFGTTADAAPKKQTQAQQARNDVRGNATGYSYRSGPRTRVYISRRSWLDAGTEVLPGERKFTDYAFPPGYSYGRTIDRVYQSRQPLNDQWDLGGYPERFPLY